MSSSLFRPASVAILAILVLVFSLPAPGRSDRSGLPLVSVTGSAAACIPEPGGLSVVAVDPQRAHLVPAGGGTTFILGLDNPAPEAQTVRLAINAHSEGWQATVAPVNELFQATAADSMTLDVEIAAGQTGHVSVMLRPGSKAKDGQMGSAEISAVSDGIARGCVSVHARVSSRPKVYAVAIDGLGPAYLTLDRAGQVNPDSNTLLMPNVARFMQQAAHFTAARSSLPASTDSNILGALSGSWPGTLGTLYVGVNFTGLDANGQLVVAGSTRQFLRWGPQGAPIRTLFDVAKDAAAGGSADAFTALITGKDWIDDLFRDEQGTVDILASGALHPFYLPQPQPYKLGDPTSDDNATTDRDGTNLEPPDEYKKHLETFNVGYDPITYPEDRWIAGGALRMMAAEDPDVLFVHLTGLDEVQHAAGSADTPSEWWNNDTPDVVWDDLNGYNFTANREPVLDVVREADTCFGLLRAALEARGALDKTVTVLFSDHGAMTYTDEKLDVESILASAGLSGAVAAASWGETSWLFAATPALVPAVEQAMQSYTMFHPILKRNVRPFTVLNRAEMKTGIDDVAGPIAASGSQRAELYSEWNIDYPVGDHSKVRWPDLMVFAGYHLQIAGSTGTSLPVPVGGHGGRTTQPVVLAIQGPGLATGSFDTPVALVDVAPTLYRHLRLVPPPHIDGRVLTEIVPSRLFLPQAARP